MQEPSIFTKIINGDIPSHKIYEDDSTFAFLDIMPVTPGHVLIVPKRQVEFVWDLTDDEYLALMTTAKKVGSRIRSVLKPSYVSQFVIGVDVPHAHVHVLPFEQSNQIRDALGAERTKAPDSELAAMADKLRFE